MTRFLWRRAGHAVFLLFGVSVLAFVFSTLAPGNYFDEMRLNPQISADRVTALRAEYQVDRPMVARYTLWAGRVLRGDLGFSFAYNTPVGPLLWARARNTLLLTGTATILVWLLALPLGVWSAERLGRPADGVVMALRGIDVVPDVRNQIPIRTELVRALAANGQLSEALVAAQAEFAGERPSLVAAALLHDLGHLLNDQGETPTLRGVDDLHQFAALPFLRGLFGDDVLEPIRLHVDAKRYLCATRDDYYAALSTDSKRSLALQGGVYSSDEALHFIRQPYADDAVKIRLWDDRAKIAGAVTPPLAHFVAALESAGR